jgi:hypothetical protein
MTVQLRWEQCCQSPGCMRPARFGSLCTACLLSASPARRAAELLADARGPALAPPPAAHGVVNAAGAPWLSELWAA